VPQHQQGCFWCRSIGKAGFWCRSMARLVFGAAASARLIFGAMASARLVFGAAASARLVFGAAASAKLIFGAAVSAKLIFGTAASAKLVIGAVALVFAAGIGMAGFWLPRHCVVGWLVFTAVWFLLRWSLYGKNEKQSTCLVVAVAPSPLVGRL